MLLTVRHDPEWPDWPVRVSLDSTVTYVHADDVAWIADDLRRGWVAKAVEPEIYDPDLKNRLTYRRDRRGGGITVAIDHRRTGATELHLARAEHIAFVKAFCAAAISSGVDLDRLPDLRAAQD